MTGSIEIREGDARAFFQAPIGAYGSEGPFVSIFDQDLAAQLDPKRNPLLRSRALAFFTAHRGSNVVGRITAHVHEASNLRHGWNRGSFGYFDCADDAEAQSALLSAAERWCLDRGHDEIWGNFNLTAMQQMGVVTEGFDRAPYSDQLWSAPHIAVALRRHGYEAEFPMTTFEIDLTGSRQSVPERRGDSLGSEVRVVPLATRRISRFFPQIRETLNDGFAANPFFVPVSKEEFDFQARDLSWVIDPAISWLAYSGTEMIGVLVMIPDLNPLLQQCRSRMSFLAFLRLASYRRRPTRAVVIFQSVKRRWQNQGVGAALIARGMESLRAQGYRSLGITWVADSNAPSLAGVRRAGGEPMHRLHLFRKKLR